MDSKLRLKRFCYLGSFEPVYVHLRGTIDVRKYWPFVQQLLSDINSNDFLEMMREIMLEASLVRKDETLFIYAGYLASSVDIKCKTAVRNAFTELVLTDNDLFLFCKYALLIATEQNRKGFSRTVRKAISAWYKHQSADAIRTMWLAHRGLHGITHKTLIKLCHISDETIGSSEVIAAIFKTCTQLVKEYEAKLDSVSEEALQSSSSNAVVTADSNVSKTTSQKSKKESEKKIKHIKSNHPVVPTNVIVAISKLRITKKSDEAIKILRKLKFHHTQVPGHLLRYPVIMETVLPTMSYIQILKYWRKMGRFNHFNKKNLMKKCKSRLNNKEFARESNIYPVHILLKLREFGNIKKLPAKRIETLKLDYLDELYKKSFNWHANSGNLRMYITLNLQTNYKKKFLKNHKKLSYYDACLALCFGYWKREAKVDVFYWSDDQIILEKIKFEDPCTIESAFASCDAVQNKKNYQRLVTPITNALMSEEIYDVFLCIVPTAGRGNPKKGSDYLSSMVDKYHRNKNPNARFIIIDLLRFKRSMTYSEIRSENILEICGLDEHTTNIIHNFATHRFD